MTLKAIAEAAKTGLVTVAAGQLQDHIDVIKKHRSEDVQETVIHIMKNFDRTNLKHKKEF